MKLMLLVYALVVTEGMYWVMSGNRHTAAAPILIFCLLLPLLLSAALALFAPGKPAARDLTEVVVSQVRPRTKVSVMDSVIGRVGHLSAVMNKAIRTRGVDPDKDVEDIAIYPEVLDIHLRDTDRVEAWARMFRTEATPISPLFGVEFLEAEASIAGRTIRMWTVVNEKGLANV